MKKCGAKAALGERCLWLWFSSTEKDAAGVFPHLIGAIPGHVDDFHRPHSEWLQVCQKVDSAYKWGMIKTEDYRHARTDVVTVHHADGTFSISVNQNAYIDGQGDLQIDPERLRGEGLLTSAESINAARHLEDSNG